MPLFNSFSGNGQAMRRPAMRRKVIVIQEPERLPEWFHRLTVICRNPAHPLPCAMKHIADASSDKGFPMAVYACPICNAREGYVRDFATGKPRRLFAKPGDAR